MTFDASGFAKSTSKSPTCCGDTDNDVVSFPALKARVPTTAAPAASALTKPDSELQTRTAAKLDARTDAHLRVRGLPVVERFIGRNVDQ